MSHRAPREVFYVQYISTNCTVLQILEETNDLFIIVHTFTTQLNTLQIRYE